MSKHSGISRREFLRIGGATAAGLLLASCSPAPTPVPPTAAPAATATPKAAALKANLAQFKVGYDNPDWSHHAADVVAREKGWFKEFGITDVSDIVFDDSMTAIVGGGVNWTAADTNVSVEAHLNPKKNVDVWWLGTRRDKEDLLFGLAPGVTIDSLKGSKAPVSGGAVGSRNELLGKKMLAELGLDPEKDVTWITMGGGSDTRIAALKSGALKGTTLQVRHRTILAGMGGKMVYDKARVIAQDGYVVMGPFLKNNADTVLAYMIGIIKAKIFMKDLKTKDEVIGIMEKAGFKFPPEFKDAYDSNINNMSADGGFDIKDMQLVWDEMAATNPPTVAKDFDWRKGIHLDILWKAQEYNGLKRRPASL